MNRVLRFTLLGLAAVVVLFTVPWAAIPAGATQEADAEPAAAERLIFSVYHCDVCRQPIYTADSDGSDIRGITDGDNPAWSPNRTKIAFHRDFGVFIANANGQRVRKLPGSQFSSGHPRWSPDGQRVVFENSDGGVAIARVARGSGPPRIVGPSWAYEPDWSPDGKRIAVVNVREEEGGIYVMNVDGTGLRRITKAPDDANDRNVRWSPNGKRLLFYREGLGRDAKGNWLPKRVYTVSPNGGPPRLLFAGDVTGLSWSPDGREIAYADAGQALRIFDTRTRRHRELKLQPCTGSGSCQDVDW